MNSKLWQLIGIALYSSLSVADWSENYEPPQCRTVSLTNGDGKLECSPSPTVERLIVKIVNSTSKESLVTVPVQVENQNPYPVKIKKLMAEVIPNGEETFFCSEHVEINLLPSQSANHVFQCKKPSYVSKMADQQYSISLRATPWD